jgi:hypothetical protein
MSRYLIEPGLLDAAQDDISLMPEPFLGLGKFVAEMGDTWAAKVLQFHPFQVVPDSLGRVQLRRIAGKLLQVNPVGRASAQVVLHCFAPVDGSAIPDDQQLPSNMPPQVPKEPNYILPSVGFLLHHQVQLAPWGDTTQGRKVVSAQGSPNQWGLSDWGIGSYQARQ